MSNEDSLGTPRRSRAGSPERPAAAPCRVLAALLLAALALPAGAATQVFNAPGVGGKRLDWCLKWGAQCGKPAADEFCRKQGFDAALGFQQAPKAGPTVVLGTGQACGPVCDAFQSIECTKAAAPAAAAAGQDVLEVEVRWIDGKPVPGALVVAVRADRPQEVHATVVGSQGTSTLYLSLGVEYLIYELNFQNMKYFKQSPGTPVSMPQAKGQSPIFSSDVAPLQ